MKLSIRALVLLFVVDSRCAAFIPSQSRKMHSQRTTTASETTTKISKPGSSRPSALHVGVAATVPSRGLQFDSDDNLVEHLRQYSGGIQKSSHSQAAMKPIKSLKRFIDNSQASIEDQELSEALSSALVRAFRTCGEVGDYRMILSLLQSAIQFCHGQALLSPRVFGEAIDALSRTDSSVTKLKQTWKLAEESSATMTQPVGAYELNVMLKALGSTRKKVQAALTIYKNTDIRGDAFTASTLLNLLADSINDNQVVAEGWNEEEDRSPCWQYQEAMQLLNDFGEINNYVVSSALKLNERACEVFYQLGRRHNGAQAALALLGDMKTRNIEPDLVTCSHVMSCFDKQHEWKAAVAMLNAMENTASSGWQFPNPNEYSYSAAISACARANQYDEAIKLLDRMKSGPLPPNTWVYNAVLSACVSPRKKNQNDRIKMSLSLLEDMQLGGDDEDAIESTRPDTVTYNTALAVMDGMGAVFRDDNGRRVCEFSESQAWMPSETLVTEMLQDMRVKGVRRDALTYHNAIKASKTNSGTIFDLLDEATKELSKQRGSSLTGRAGNGLSFVYNAALSSFAQRGDMDLMVRAFAQMRKVGVDPNNESVMQLVVALGRSRNSRNIMTLLQTLRGNRAASDKLHELFGIDLSISVTGNKSRELEQLYAVSITSCLVANDIESAMAALALMKENGMSPSQSTMKEIAFAYTRVAVEAASQQSAVRRKSNKYAKSVPLQYTEKQYSRAQAVRAGAIANELKHPSPQLLAAVSTAYAVTGLFEEARTIVQKLHQHALVEQSNSKFLSRAAQEILDVLPRLHRSLLKICASHGNVMAALWFVEDIQRFANDFSSDSSEICLTDTPLVPDVSDPAECNNLLWFNRTHTDTARQCGMRGEDWKLFLIAASKSGEWKLCINTLQFLRPFLEANHPKRAQRTQADLPKKYRKLARALTASVLCFEAREQSAWAVRAIDDWIEWSGRRPPKEAVLASIRILASQDRGTEVTSLIQQCLQVSPSSSDSREEAQHSYEEIIYIGAVTHLHNNGLYEDADELYLQAITNKHLPFSVSMLGNHHILDLHGMNVAIANSAVRIAFQQDVLQSETSGDLVIVTGRGMNSIYQMRPVIRPEIQRMLTEEFYPPLNTASMPGNMGALRVPAEDIQAWVTHQRQQKGVKMLAVAGALKNLSGGLLIKRGVKLSVNRKSEKSE
jgi:pentatricopeptide repeat protein